MTSGAFGDLPSFEPVQLVPSALAHGDLPSCCDEFGALGSCTVEIRACRNLTSVCNTGNDAPCHKRAPACVTDTASSLCSSFWTACIWGLAELRTCAISAQCACTWGLAKLRTCAAMTCRKFAISVQCTCGFRARLACHACSLRDGVSDGFYETGDSDGVCTSADMQDLRSSCHGSRS